MQHVMYNAIRYCLLLSMLVTGTNLLPSDDTHILPSDWGSLNVLFDHDFEPHSPLASIETPTFYNDTSMENSPVSCTPNNIFNEESPEEKIALNTQVPEGKILVNNSYQLYIEWAALMQKEQLLNGWALEIFHRVQQYAEIQNSIAFFNEMRHTIHPTFNESRVNRARQSLENVQREAPYFFVYLKDELKKKVDGYVLSDESGLQDGTKKVVDELFNKKNQDHEMYDLFFQAISMHTPMTRVGSTVSDEKCLVALGRHVLTRGGDTDQIQSISFIVALDLIQKYSKRLWKEPQLDWRQAMRIHEIQQKYDINYQKTVQTDCMKHIALHAYRFLAASVPGGLFIQKS